MSILSNQVLIPFSFSGKLWKHEGKYAWHFISLPTEISNDIRHSFKKSEEGWGRLKCKAQIQGVEWQTSIWYDTKHALYLLPLKAEIRRKANVNENEIVDVVLYI